VEAKPTLRGTVMKPVPPSVAEFLAGKRLVVAGVSRKGQSAANAVFRRFRETGHDAVPVNPNASELEGVACFPDVASVPGPVDGVLVATHPSVAAEVVRQAAARGVRRIWFHRSFGDGSVSPEALAACREAGITPIVGGCPLMYAGRVDPAHGFMRWWLRLLKRVPG
jgi:predicted CoA-binding protein